LKKKLLPNLRWIGTFNFGVMHETKMLFTGENSFHSLGTRKKTLQLRMSVKNIQEINVKNSFSIIPNHILQQVPDQ